MLIDPFRRLTAVLAAPIVYATVGQTPKALAAFS